ncbi:MAG: tRNA (guanosine(37)-N1)-methyltransferase TrmD [Alphaproteobacteria bacterium]
MEDFESSNSLEEETLWKAKILTIFPEMFPGFLGQSLAGKALDKKIWELEVFNIRDYTFDKHRSVDDVPFGGGAGMLMKPEVLDSALSKVYHNDGPLIYMSPRGKVLSQERVVELSKEKNITVLCGRFEGVDERILEKYDFEEVSVGDFVLSGGEPAALVMIDAVVRLLPGVMGKEESFLEESFAKGLLEYPQYTRPANWEGREVPEVLISGHHKKISEWQKQKAIEITKERRPDLWEKYLTKTQE